MRSDALFNKRYWWFLGVTCFVGMFPLLLYPLSKYYGRSGEYSDFNHGPLHQYPAGGFVDAAPAGVDWVIDATFGWPPLLLLLLSLVLVIYFFFTRRFKVGFSYLIPAALSFVFILLQLFVLYWLFD
ncbi:MAG: hypothetical protein ACKO7P_04490 [Bacteroidota bacterium]